VINVAPAKYKVAATGLELVVKGPDSDSDIEKLPV
jgi:hypothetical protein